MLLSLLQPYCCNDLSNFPKYDNYSLMIGLSPSTGARSPMLWNSVLRKFNISSAMIPLDINSLDDLSSCKNIITSNPDLFVGGAVTAPYKEPWFSFSDTYSECCKLISATNNFYMIEDSMCCDNTDSSGFKLALSEILDLLSVKQIILFGNGGVASAVISSLVSEQIPIIQYSRSSFVSPYSNVTNFTYSSSILPDQDSPTLLINCTSVGDYTNPDNSLLVYYPFLSQLKEFNLVAAFDCIHTPSQTSFMSFFNDYCQTYNGKRMNHLQAVAGFSNVYSFIDINEIDKIMTLAANEA